MLGSRFSIRNLPSARHVTTTISIFDISTVEIEQNKILVWLQLCSWCCHQPLFHCIALLSIVEQQSVFRWRNQKVSIRNRLHCKFFYNFYAYLQSHGCLIFNKFLKVENEKNYRFPIKRGNLKPCTLWVTFFCARLLFHSGTLYRLLKPSAIYVGFRRIRFLK